MLSQEQELKVNIKSLYRLNDPHQPIARLDLRVAGAICQICEVTLSELVDFGDESATLVRISDEKQQRLDLLMGMNNEGKLTQRKQRELQKLVIETQEITLHNARLLADQQRRLEKN